MPNWFSKIKRLEENNLLNYLLVLGAFTEGVIRVKSASNETLKKTMYTIKSIVLSNPTPNY